MLYTCESCLFTFIRIGKTDACPDCGKSLVREATETEKSDYKKYREEYGEEDKKKIK